MDNFQLHLTEAEARTVENALDIAASVFDESAATCREASNPGLERVAVQFDKQARDSRIISDAIATSGLL